MPLCVRECDHLYLRMSQLDIIPVKELAKIVVWDSRSIGTKLTELTQVQLDRIVSSALSMDRLPIRLRRGHSCYIAEHHE
jgi:hypothetical protein